VLIPLLLFVATLITTVWLLLRMAQQAAPGRHGAFSTLLLVWFLLTGTLAYSQALSNFQRMPPLLPVCILIAIGTVTYMASTLRSEIPLPWLIGYQAFRIPVEIFLHTGFLAGFVPVQMTWAGRNWDVLTGISAIPMAWLASRNSLPRWAAHVWNLIGFALLFNVMTIAFLSFPTPFRQFHNDPANFFVTQIPFVWLPLVLVPAAWFGHIALFRQLKRAYSGDPKP
jgi:hypothetical protein